MRAVHKLRALTRDRPKTRPALYLESQEFIGFIASARKAAGITQVDPATRLGRPQSFGSKVEQGDAVWMRSSFAKSRRPSVAIRQSCFGSLSNLSAEAHHSREAVGDRAAAIL